MTTGWERGEQDGLLSLVTTPSPAYVATVKHFSYVNSDLVKVGQACIAVRSDSTMPSSYTIEVTVPPKVAGRPRIKDRHV